MKKILLICLSLAFVACEDFVDVNDDQSNNPTADILTPRSMISGAINDYVSYQTVSLNDFGNYNSYVWALNNGYTSTASYFTFNFTSSDYAGLFSTAYLYADNFQDILDKKNQFPNFSHHYGVAKIFKVMSMDYVVSLYGDAPYTQAFNSNIPKPKYDDDATIIPKLFAELDEARTLLEDTSADVEVLGSEDIVFGGDTTQWIKFLNTIELKLLLRLSKTTNANLITLRNDRFAALNQDFITQTVKSNPGYGDANLSTRNPIWRTWGLNESKEAWLSAYDSQAAAEFCSKLVYGTLNTSDITTGITDPRRARIFNAATNTKQGVFPTAVVARMAGFFNGRTGASADIANKAAAERPSYLMLAAESYFLQAEAIQRGYMSGDAKAAFENGITASFDHYNDFSFTEFTTPPTVLNAATYITASANKNGLGWNGSTDKINCIMTQKYIALAQWHGVELYLDHLRTGYPKLPMPEGVTQTTRPYRLIYPTSEYSRNAENVPNVTLDDLFIINSKTPVYLQ